MPRQRRWVRRPSPSRPRLEWLESRQTPAVLFNGVEVLGASPGDSPAFTGAKVPEGQSEAVPQPGQQEVPPSPAADPTATPDQVVSPPSGDLPSNQTPPVGFTGADGNYYHVGHTADGGYYYYPQEPPVGPP